MFKAIAAAAVASALLATPVFAQEAIQEPGSFAFYHPYLDVVNGGAPTPALKIANDPAAMQGYVAHELGTAQHHRTHR
jgi:opacity protein-like surface antigen